MIRGACEIAPGAYTSKQSHTDQNKLLVALELLSQYFSFSHRTTTQLGSKTCLSSLRCLGPVTART